MTELLSLSFGYSAETTNIVNRLYPSKKDKIQKKKKRRMSNSSISIYGWVHYLSFQVGTYKRLACSSDLNMKNIVAI